MISSDTSSMFVVNFCVQERYHQIVSFNLWATSKVNPDEIIT